MVEVWISEVGRRVFPSLGSSHSKPRMSWLKNLTPVQRRALLAACLGWMFDAMDFLVYVLAIGRLKTYFGFGDATAGLLGTLTLVSAAVGGVGFGAIGERVGRGRALYMMIAVLSIFFLRAAN